MILADNGIVQVDEGLGFYETFSPVFRTNARWSTRFGTWRLHWVHLFRYVSMLNCRFPVPELGNEKTDMSKVHKVGCKLRASDCKGLMFDTRMRSVLQFLALLWFVAWLLHAWRVPYCICIGSGAALLKILTSCSPLLHQDQRRYNLDDAEFREERNYGLIWPCFFGIQYSQPFVCGDGWHAELRKCDPVTGTLDENMRCAVRMGAARNDGGWRDKTNVYEKSVLANH